MENHTKSQNVTWFTSARWDPQAVEIRSLRDSGAPELTTAVLRGPGVLKLHSLHSQKNPWDDGNYIYLHTNNHSCIGTYTSPSWWFQPISKILVKFEIIPKQGNHHHPDYSLFGLGILGNTSSEKGPESPLKIAKTALFKKVGRSPKIYLAKAYVRENAPPKII